MMKAKNMHFGGFCSKIIYCLAPDLPRFLHSFIHSGYFYIASSSPVLLRGAPDTARILCRNLTTKRHRQL